MKPSIQRSILMALKLLFIAAIAGIYISALFSYPEKNNLLIIITNFIIVAYSTYRSFFSQRYSYSIYQFFYIFSLLFMGLAPLVQYKQSIETVGGYNILDNTYISTNTILIAVFVLIDFIYGYRHKRKNKITQQKNVLAKMKHPIKDTRKLKFLLIVLSSISLGYVIYINQNDLIGLFYRDILIDRIDIADTMIKILTGILRPLSIFSFIFYYKLGNSRFLKTVLFIMATITCFPLALTRFLIGAYWIPVVITIFQSFNTKKILGYLYTLGLLILFPMLEIFRVLSLYIERGNLIGAFSNKISEAFSSIAYDSYQSLAFVIQHHFITFGNQLLGVLGLFIPRSIWVNKPIGSGFTISNIYDLSWDNISMNFFGEGYVNFGIIGIFIFAAALAVAIRYLDSKYWLKNNKNSLLFSIIYLVVLGIFAYIMRGDMMGSFTSTISVIISAALVYFVICLARKVQG